MAGDDTKRIERGDRGPPAWAIYLLGGAGLLGVGGAGGSFATGNSVSVAISASEAKIIGEVRLLAQRLDAQAAQAERIEDEMATMRDRLHKLELDAARTAGS